MKTTKRVLLISSLTCLALSCLLLILAIFGVKVFEGAIFRVLLISSTFAVGAGIALTELNILARRKVLGLVSLGFLSVSVLLALISFCSPLMEVPVFNRITGVIALFSVLLATIISLNTKLEKRFIALQAVTYIALSLVVLLVVIIVCGVNIFEINGILQAFLVLCVITVGLLIATTVVSSKNKGDEKSKPELSDSQNLKLENENLKLENVQLKAEIEKLKQELKSLKN